MNSIETILSMIETKAIDDGLKSGSNISRTYNNNEGEVMRIEFEEHFLSLKFATEGSAQDGLDACTFDEKQDAYLPNIDWILENDEDECIAYCLVVNAAYISFKHQQSKVDELHKISVALNTETIRQREQVAHYLAKNAELRKRVDDLTELNRLKTIALQQSVNRTSAYVHEKIVALEQALKGRESNG